MKTVASDVPPTGTFSIGTGKASTNVEARSSATRPARVAAEGSYAAMRARANTQTSVPAKTTGATMGRSREVSRDTLTVRSVSGRDSATDLRDGHVAPLVVPAGSTGGCAAENFFSPSIKPCFPLLSKVTRARVAA